MQPDEKSMKVGREFASLRSRAKLSQQACGKMLGITQPAISMIEAGRIVATEQRLAALRRLARSEYRKLASKLRRRNGISGLARDFLASVSKSKLSRS